MMTFARAVLIACIVLPLLSLSADAQGNYRIRGGDVLQMEVLEDPSLNRDLLVLPDGNVTVPFVGAIRARGRTLSQVQANIRSRLGPSFAEPPNVFVGLSSLAEIEEREPVTIDVYVVGEVETPGKREIEPGTTVLQFLAEMGGFTDFAATKRIQLRTSRTGREQVYSLNYNDVELGGGVGTSTVLADGDVIVVPQRRLFE
ncbi:polysaccharide biosynthesis/export family protein [Yoonia sp. 2307UL14-13]|uniref:polysaccharide biosynthesis/export family protein n=1 Tax=Yoonia sp. 2307UL14-13 TaxID=3126506 RepID=UPI00309D7D76